MPGDSVNNADVGDATPLDGDEKLPKATVCNCSVSKKHRSNKTPGMLCFHPS